MPRDPRRRCAVAQLEADEADGTPSRSATIDAVSSRSDVRGVRSSQRRQAFGGGSWTSQLGQQRGDDCEVGVVVVDRPTELPPGAQTMPRIRTGSISKKWPRSTSPAPDTARTRRPRHAAARPRPGDRRAAATPRSPTRAAPVRSPRPRFASCTNSSLDPALEGGVVEPPPKPEVDERRPPRLDQGKQRKRIDVADRASKARCGGLIAPGPKPWSSRTNAGSRPASSRPADGSRRLGGRGTARPPTGRSGLPRFTWAITVP